jgi:hypothetical protein
MFTLVIPEQEMYDEATNSIKHTRSYTMQLEHSLVSMSKWEAKWKKPFISPKDEQKTLEETIDYIKCMTITQNVPAEAYNYLTQQNLIDITKYINDPMTATTVREMHKIGPREIVTSELIYYWMIANDIPFECQKWHLNRLMMLIRVCGAKNAPGKKMAKNDILKQYAAANAARRHH